MTVRDRIDRAREALAEFLARGPKPAKLPRPAGPDRLLCGAALVLTALGVVMVFSASTVKAANDYGDWTYFLKRVAIFAVVGLGAFTVAVRTDYGVWRRITYPSLFVALVLNALVPFLGNAANGATRWFRLGPISFQPAELAKVALLLYVAVLLARKAEKVREFSVGFLPPLMVTGCFLGFLLLQKDLGTSVILGATVMAMLFVAGTRTSFILLAVLGAAPIVWQFVILGKEYRVKRLLAFLNPWEYRRDDAYQLVQSLYSIGSGGPTGLGLGMSRQKLLFLPEAHTDFILAIIGEELGLIGVGFVILCFAVLVWRGVLAAFRARDLFGSFLAFGITFLLGLQALTNMCVVLALVPTKGLPLPFVSYGGTALVFNLLMVGVLANVSARAPEPRAVPFLHALRVRGVRARNRRAEPGARVVVEVPGRRKAQAQTPCAS